VNSRSSCRGKCRPFTVWSAIAVAAFVIHTSSFFSRADNAELAVVVRQNEESRHRLKSFSYSAVESDLSSPPSGPAFADKKAWQVLGQGSLRRLTFRGHALAQSSHDPRAAASEIIDIERRLVLNNDYAAEWDMGVARTIDKWDISGVENVPPDVGERLRAEFGIDPISSLYGDGSKSIQEIYNLLKDSGQWETSHATTSEGSVVRVTYSKHNKDGKDFGWTRFAEFDFDPEKDFLVTSYTTFLPSGEVGMERRVHLVQDQKTQLWFPSTLTITMYNAWLHQHDNDLASDLRRKPHSKQEFTFSEVKLNELYDPDQFSIMALRAPAEAIVVDHSIDGKDSLMVLRDGKFLPQSIASAFDAGEQSITKLEHLGAEPIPMQSSSPASHLQVAEIGKPTVNDTSSKAWLAVLSACLGLGVACVVGNRLFRRNSLKR
jgi:hypothetical protein